MSWIGRAISSVGQYYKEINPATLSGAIDVIVVANKRAAPNQDTPADPSNEDLVDLACSPWHVRFGKLNVLRPVERKVRILVNGQPAPFSMKIGETGEAFFVFETDVEDLPDDLQTSPLVSPVLKSSLEPTDPQNSATRPLESVPDFADLGEPELESDQMKRNSSRDTPLQNGQPDSITSSIESYDPNSSEPSGRTNPYRKVEADQETQSNELAPISPQTPWTHTVGFQPDPKNDSLGKSSPAKQESESIRKSSKIPERRGSNPIAHLSLHHAQVHDFGPRTASSLPTADLMLDMDGYKVTHDTPDRRERNSNDPNLESSSSIQKTLDQVTAGSSRIQDVPEEFSIELQESLVMDFTTALLRCSERINRCFFSASGSHPELEVNENVIIHVENHDASDQPIENSESDCEGLILVECVEDKNGYGRFDRFKIESNGTWHLFEISLFNLPQDHHDPTNLSEQHRVSRPHPPRRYNHHKFQENRLTFGDFFGPKSDPSVEGNLRKDLCDDEANFIVRYNEKFILTWENASTALTSLGICRKSIINLSPAQLDKVVQGASRNDSGPPSFIDTPKMEAPASHRLHLSNPTDPNNYHDTQSPQPPVSYTRPWTRWWYKADRSMPAESSHQRQNPHETWDQSKAQGVHSSGDMKTSPSSSPPTSPSSLAGTAQSDLGPKENLELAGEESTAKPYLPATTLGTSSYVPKTEDPPKIATSTNHKTYAKTLRLTSDQLKQLGLKKGTNQVSFSVRSSYSGYAVCTSRIFLWDADYKICISDIDGTITKSDALGHVFNMIGRDWTHAGVAKLYTDISRNGYKIMYLTSRAIGQANTTREYLKGINQMGYVLPEGPVIMSPDRLMTSLHREVIMRKPEIFKMACLRDIKRLFGPNRSPFYAGFGNRITDALSYRAVDVPSSRIFTIDSNGEVKMELLELTGYKSSYIHMTDLVDQMFPPINRNPATPEFTDFNYWRSVGTSYDALSLIGLDLDELLSPNPNANGVPVSPTLSARSGESSIPTSRLTFRLSGLTLGRKTSKADLPSSQNTPKNSVISSRTSFLTISSSVGTRRESVQAEGKKKINGNKFEDDSDEEQSVQLPHRLRSDSMPGSLPGSLEEASLLESLRRGAYRNTSPTTEVTDEDRSGLKKGNPEEGSTADEDEFPQMDFSSVPYL